VIALTIYSRPGCHLCEDMKAVVERVARSIAEPVTLDEVDIPADADLEARYGLEIPVLTIDGRKVAKYRVEEFALRRMLKDRAGSPPA
jgi:hypothetical protein